MPVSRCVTPVCISTQGAEVPSEENTASGSVLAGKVNYKIEQKMVSSSGERGAGSSIF